MAMLSGFLSRTYLFRHKCAVLPQVLQIAASQCIVSSQGYHHHIQAL